MAAAGGGQSKPTPTSTPAPTSTDNSDNGLGSLLGGLAGFIGSAGQSGAAQNAAAYGGLPGGAFGAWLRANGITADMYAADPSTYIQLYHSITSGGGASGSSALAAQVERERLAEQRRADLQNEAIARERLERERQTQLSNTQSGFLSDLMKQGQSPESFYNYLFARYGEQAPMGQQVQSLPLPSADVPLTLNPQTNQYNAGELAQGITRLGQIPGVVMGQGGAAFTLPPYLQRLFTETGQNVSTLPIGQQPAGYKYSSYGTPSAQSWNQFAPTEQQNALGYAGSVTGTPSSDEQANIQRLAPQGSGLETPTAFARGGLMMPDRYAQGQQPYMATHRPVPGFPQNMPYAHGGVMPALGGVAGTGVMPPMPQGGIATQPTMGPAPNQTFGEAGPEAAVPLNSPGGPMAMQALQQNQRAGMQPAMPPPIAPTSREAGLYTTKPLLPMADVPNNKLGPGMRGEAVVRLQRALEQAGYLQLPQGVNFGYFGPLTTEAVARLQQESGHPGQPGLWDGAIAKALTQRLLGPQGPQGPNPYHQREQV